MELITMLFVAEGGAGMGVKPVSMGVPGWLDGWISCPNSSSSTKRLLKKRSAQMIQWRNRTDDNGRRGGKKYQT